MLFSDWNIDHPYMQFTAENGLIKAERFFRVAIKV
jgi:hypothetical protein